MKSKNPNNCPQKRGFRQTMTDLHIWVGLVVGWLLFAIFLTGTASFFKEEITAWMQPEIMPSEAVEAADQLTARMVQTMQSIAPESPSWYLSLPTARRNTAEVYWLNTQGEQEYAVLDAATGELLPARETARGDFFYLFHLQLHYLPWMAGRIIVGLCAMFMLVAIISGVIIHKRIFVDFFTFRWGKGQRSWLDAHNGLAVLGLPFHAMITYTGLVTLMTLYMPWGFQAAFPTPKAQQQASSQIYSYVPPGERRGQQAPLTDIATLVRQAEQSWGGAPAGIVRINNPNDATALVMIDRSNMKGLSDHPPFAVFDGVSGELLRAKNEQPAATDTYGVMIGLHAGRFGDWPTRWLYFLLGLAGTAMVGSGLVLWTVKRRKTLPDPDRPYFGFWLVEKLNIATIAGLPVAMTAFFWGNRLLPLELTQRGEWEIHLFFIVWLLMLLHALLRPAKRAWLEQLSLAALLMALLPILNGFTTSRGLLTSLAQGDWLFANFDLILWLLSAMFAYIAYRASQYQAVVPGRRSAAPPITQGQEAN
jgi:uncharacterized iron-regulated membrane protein